MVRKENKEAVLMTPSLELAKFSLTGVGNQRQDSFPKTNVLAVMWE